MQKILLVEDDETLTIGIDYSLKNAGYKIDIAATVAKAKAFINQTDYNLIILDIGLPDGNGFDLCKYIRKDKETPIIFLTAQDEEVNVVMGLDIGADDYITKPFRIKELLSRINAIIRRTARKADNKHLESGAIKVNLLESKVYVSKELVGLTPSEYKLLLILMNHSHQVLSRIQILEMLWDVEGNFVDDNSLSVYIRRLRKKIEKDSTNPVYIKTVRGIGYRWDIDVRR